ncbi:multiple cyclophane-containing RiPP AmcA [Micromonospora tulbaghiae]
MTVYLSRNATMGDPPRGRPAAAQALRRASVDPPLMTYVWQIVFERQTREREAR